MDEARGLVKVRPTDRWAHMINVRLNSNWHIFLHSVNEGMLTYMCHVHCKFSHVLIVVMYKVMLAWYVGTYIMIFPYYVLIYDCRNGYRINLSNSLHHSCVATGSEQ